MQVGALFGEFSMVGWRTKAKGGLYGAFVRHAEAGSFPEVLLGFWSNDSFLVICQGLLRSWTFHGTSPSFSICKSGMFNNFISNFLASDRQILTQIGFSIASDFKMASDTKINIFSLLQ